MNRSFAILPTLLLTMLGAGCSSQESEKTAAKPGPPVPQSGVMMAENRKHPLAKYLEIAGIRLSESKQGKLTVHFAIVNHSDADIADLGLAVGLKPITAKAEDPPFCSFTVKVPALPPQETFNATAECPTTLRVYELPDWQFIHAVYQITSPQP